MKKRKNLVNKYVKKVLVTPKTLFSKNIGMMAMVTGEFGELLVAHILTRERIPVILAQTVGFDLLVKDGKGKYFKKNVLIGISVKTRLKIKGSAWALNLRNEIPKLEAAAKFWRFEPYYGLVSNSGLYIFPLNIAKSSRVKTNKGRFSLAKLKKLRSSRIVFFEWSCPEV